MANIKKSAVATEAFVKKEIETLHIEMDERFSIVDEKLNIVDERLIKMDEKFDKMMNNLDWLVGSYKKFGEEHTTLSQHNSDNTDEIEELKERVAKLEKLVHKLTAQ
jgi:hypothetical protein